MAYGYRDWIKSVGGGVILAGDNFDACIPCHKSETMWAQDMNPGDQYKKGIEFYEPIKDQIVMGCTSNHSNRIWKATSVDLDEHLADKLGYLNNYVGPLGQRTLKVGKMRYKVALAHGQSGGIRNPWGDAHKIMAIYPDTDVVLLSHRHKMDQTLEIQVRGKKHKKIQFVRTGSVMDYARYAQQAMYPPSAKGFAILYLDDSERRFKVDTSGEIPRKGEHFLHPGRLKNYSPPTRKDKKK